MLFYILFKESDHAFIQVSCIYIYYKLFGEHGFDTFKQKHFLYFEFKFRTIIPCPEKPGHKNIFSFLQINGIFRIILTPENEFTFTRIILNKKGTELLACFSNTVLRIYNQACKPDRFSWIGLHIHSFFYFIEFCQVEDSIMFDFKFEMIQRMSAHKHTRDLFFMIEQFCK